ncbi:S8 family serine peptidase [Luteimonas salinilitoris]|uniref:S8 family serine peptidase n=1 Tax=Luteimonas salinilitoris TaxID=3237697 RepID=A0ABV4HQ91_9GAMM
MTGKKIKLRAITCAIALSLAGTAFAADRIEYERINLGALVDGESYGELVVKYREGTPQRQNPGSVANAIGASWTAALGSGAASAGQPLHVRRLGVGADVIRLPKLLDVAEARQLMRQIAADPAVEYVEPVVRMEKFAVPDDPRWDEQWHYHAPEESAGGINLAAALDHADGSGVVVAVLDTGLTDHPDLSANVLMDEGYDFVLRQPGGSDPGDFQELCLGTFCFLISPSSWHGTHVAGTVAAVTNDGIGVAGVAPNAVVLPVRVLGPGGGSSTDISDAILWSSGGEIDGVPANEFPADVINMSLGSGSPVACPNVYKDALAEAHRRDVTVVVAAGNSGNNSANEWGLGHTMGNCSEDIVVVGGTGPAGARGGVARDGTLLSRGSNHGGRIDIAAPYGIGTTVLGDPDNVLSTLNTGQRGPEEPTYEFYPGTSMASPHVAGAVALMQSVAPNRLSPDQVKQILKSTARPFPVELDKPVGIGILDAEAAVLAAMQPPCDQTDEGCALPPQQLFNAAPLMPLSADADDGVLYSFEATAGSMLNIMASGGAGDASLYVGFGTEPTADAYDFRSVRPGNNEVVRIAAPQAGTYFIRVTGEYEGITLRAQQARADD